jgi:hypothetical protein
MGVIVDVVTAALGVLEEVDDDEDVGEATMVVRYILHESFKSSRSIHCFPQGHNLEQ